MMADLCVQSGQRRLYPNRSLVQHLLEFLDKWEITIIEFLQGSLLTRDVLDKRIECDCCRSMFKCSCHRSAHTVVLYSVRMAERLCG